MKKNVVILYGGASTEREVSFATCDSIYKNLSKEKFNVTKIELPKDKSNNWALEVINQKPDIVISALHGGNGENGSVQGFLNCLNIPYVGTGVLGSAVGMDKYITKKILKASGINVADAIFVKCNEEIEEYKNEIMDLGFPIVVKPNSGGSSIGVKIVDNFDKLKEAVLEVYKLKEDATVEKFIKGSEVTCGVIEKGEKLQALDVLDIKPKNGFYDYFAKYEDDDTKIDISTLSESVIKKVQDISIKTFKSLNAKDYARVDLIVDSKGDVYVLEINTLPGMTSHSLIPKSLKAKNIPYDKFLEDLIENSLDSKAWILGG